MLRRVTTSDVAKHAGVSYTTVSHVINETRFVAEETRQRVLQAIVDLNYTPSQVARSLATQQTYSVGLLISDVGNPFYHRVILGVEDVALAHGYNVFLMNASYDLNRSIKYIRSMAERRVDGILLMSSSMSEELLAETQENQLPTVILDWLECSAPDVGAITFDFEMGIRQAVAHLIELGHRRFAHVSGDLKLFTARIRRDLFLKILAEYGIDPIDVPVIEGNFRIDGGRRAFRELESDPRKPTAVVTVNDMIAIGIILEAQNAGFRIPDQLSVIGVDDISLASELVPSLTTISLHGYEIGAMAMNLLLDLKGKSESVDTTRCHRVVDTTLVIRQSTTRPPD
jgi:DNA-binding LacI/PurR family transcriptional regulator